MMTYSLAGLEPVRMVLKVTNEHLHLYLPVLKCVVTVYNSGIDT